MGEHIGNCLLGRSFFSYKQLLAWTFFFSLSVEGRSFPSQVGIVGEPKDSQAGIELTGLVVEHIGNCLLGRSFFFFIICGGSIHSPPRWHS